MHYRVHALALDAVNLLWTASVVSDVNHAEAEPVEDDIAVVACDVVCIGAGEEQPKTAFEEEFVPVPSAMKRLELSPLDHTVVDHAVKSH